MTGNSQPAPPEQAAPPVVAAFFIEFIPSLENEYELLEKGGEGPLKMSLPDLQMETLIFGLHCLDRMVFARCGATYRAAFMDQALATARDAFAEVIPESARDAFIDSFRDHYNTRQHEYGAMKLVSSDGAGREGVLSYEYGKRICFDAGVDNPAVVAVMVQGATSIVTMMMKIAKTL